MQSAISSRGENRQGTYGLLNKTLKKWQLQYPWINRNLYNYYVKSKKTEPPETVVTITSVTVVSDLTSQTESLDPEHNKGLDQVTVISSSLSKETASNVPEKRSGRPKGTTNQKKRHDKVQITHAANFVAVSMKKKREEAKISGKDRVERGAYDEIIKKAKVMFNVPDDVPLKERCRQRVSRRHRNILVVHKGTPSPMLRVEAHLIDIFVQYSRMRQPITPEVGIALANSLVKGTEVEEQIKEWRKKCLPKAVKASVEDIEEENEENLSDGNLVGRSWWKFLKCNPGLTTKKAVRFDSQRDDWCSVQNFEAMYEEVYEAMVESGVASKFDEEQFLDSEGNIVEKEEDAFGRKTKYLLTRPEYVFFVDDVGDNTSQKNDGNVGGQMFVVGKNERTLIRASYADNHFTVLGFTTADGNPV
jgi:hypothetical protein